MAGYTRPGSDNSSLNEPGTIVIARGSSARNLACAVVRALARLHKEESRASTSQEYLLCNNVSVIIAVPDQLAEGSSRDREKFPARARSIKNAR